MPRRTLWFPSILAVHRTFLMKVGSKFRTIKFSFFRFATIYSQIANGQPHTSRGQLARGLRWESEIRIIAEKANRQKPSTHYRYAYQDHARQLHF